MSYTARMTLAGLVIVCALAGVSAQQPPAGQAQLAEVLAALKEKRRAPGNETYTFSIEVVNQLGDGKSRKSRIAEDFQIDWPTGKFREEGLSTYMYPNEGLQVFDGKRVLSKLRNVTDDGKATSDWKYGIITGDHRNNVYVALFWPIFFNRGVIKSAGSQGFYPGHLTFDAPEDAFFLHRHLVLDGSKCAVLRSFPEGSVDPVYYETVVDPGKGYGVRAFSMYVNNVRTLQIDIPLKLWPDGWAPAGWTLTRTSNGRVHESAKATVTQYAKDVPVGSDNDYAVTPPDGAKVGRSDYSAPGATSDFTRTEYQYEVRDGRLVQTGGPAEGFWAGRRLLWYGLGALTLVLIGMLLVRRFRRPLQNPRPEPPHMQ
ncbi:MAG: hypothetical protein K2X87_07430 [Gemmataceae bacterium]|nr:hypothetical protein [Gemmataceae bacterium]